MNLSSLVHEGKPQAEQNYNLEIPRARRSITSLLLKPHEAEPTSIKSSYTCVTPPQPPPSPPADESPKCSLPSISSLFGVADTSKFPEHNQSVHPQYYSQAHRNGSFEIANQSYIHPSPANFRANLPPTPPLYSEPTFGGRQLSPSVASNSGHSVSSTPTYFFAPNSPYAAPEINTFEIQGQRQYASSPPSEGRNPVQSQIRSHSQPIISINTQHQTSSPRSSNCYSVPLPKSQVSGLYSQRPLPQQFPPSIISHPPSLATPSASNPLQHHHYISPSSAASFPPTQDRYICQTCNKAFSRPSSLRIHSHSHTGEKPFKCPHQGCGKAFSVRSNMKRHERGCHNYEGSVTA